MTHPVGLLGMVDLTQSSHCPEDGKKDLGLSLNSCTASCLFIKLAKPRGGKVWVIIYTRMIIKEQETMKEFSNKAAVTKSFLTWHET